jgi:hypothetical protein
MLMARFVRAMWLLLLLGFAAALVGCDSGTQQGPTGVDEATKKIIIEENKSAHRKASGAGQDAATAKIRAQMKRGHN